LEIARVVLDAFPSLVDPDAEGEQADPFVLSMAIEQRNPAGTIEEQLRLRDGGQEPIPRRCVVVTEESRRPERRRLPQACDRFGVPSMRHLDFVKALGIRLRVDE
jgi:hypothetical protein